MLTKRNTMYNRNIVIPRLFVIFHLFAAMVTMTATSIPISSPTEVSSALVSPLTMIQHPSGFLPDLQPGQSKLWKIHGMGSPMRMSKMLEPIEDDTAMSPWPCLATMTEVIRSGIEVPAARKVRPIIVGGILIRSPRMLTHQTMK